MDYPNKTLTRDGAALLAGDDADGNPTIADKMVVSNQVPQSNGDLELDTLHIQDFSNEIYFPIDAYKHNGATFQAESIFDNSNVSKKMNSKNSFLQASDDGKYLQLGQDYQIMMIGLLGHEGNVNDADETLIAVSLVDLDNPSPYEMPKVSSVPFTFTMAMNLTYSNAENVKAIISPAGSVTESDLENAIKPLEIEINFLKGKPATAPQISAQMDVNDGTVNYAITPPKWNGGTEIQSYQLNYAPVGSNQTNKIDVDADNLVGSINNLNPNQKYNISVNAVNSYGSGQSNTVTTTIGNPPNEPSINATMDIAAGTIKYTVTSNGAGSTPISQYKVFYKQTSDSDNGFKEIDSVNSTGEISKLDPHQKYDVYAEAVNQAGPSQASQIVVTNIIDSSVYGVAWNRTSSPVLRRTDGALGMQAGINGSRDDFDNAGPWQKMHRVTDDNGNVFVRVPKFYIYKQQDGTENDGNLYVKVSLINHGNGWYLPKCFWSFQNSQPLDYVDVGAYDGNVENGNLHSTDGAVPSNNISMDDFRRMARNNGREYGIMDIHTIDALTCLFIVEYATLDSKSVMEGNDHNNHKNMLNNGATDGHAGSSGTDTGNRNGTMNYRGIENLWGNLWQWIDGVNLNGGPVWICDDQTQYQSNVYAAPYQQLSYTTKGGNTSSIGLDTSHPEANFATQTNGNGNNYFCDVSWLDNSGYVPIFGGDWSDTGDYVGLFCWDYDVPSNRSSYYGARLIKKESV